MERNEKILLGVACFGVGVVAGFLIAPIKNGVYCRNNSNINGNDNTKADINKSKAEKEVDELEEIIVELRNELNNGS